MTFAIRFRLQDVDAITPWGAPGDRSLGWFGLTYGCCCIETPQGRLLETPRPHGPFAEPWDCYQVARLFDDLLAAWPAIAEPIPDDIFALIDAGFEARIDALDASDDEAFWDAVSGACDWFKARHVSMMHHTSGPSLHLWRSGDTVRLRWIANPSGRAELADHWTVARADCRLRFNDVEQGVRGFADEFLGAMATRVESIRREGWTRGCALDVDLLVKALRDEETWAAKTLATVARTDWAAVREALRKIGLL